MSQAPAAPPASGKTRIEHDLLGDLAVPADAYYGVQTARAIENFKISGVPLRLYQSSRCSRRENVREH